MATVKAPENDSVHAGVGKPTTVLPCALLLGLENGAAAVENSNGAPREIK